MPLTEIKNSLAALADPERARNLQWFFKTGPGEYGEGDKFHGIKVPEVRKVAKRFVGIEVGEASSLLKSPLHEERLAALLILVAKFAKGDEDEKKLIYDLYLANTQYVNNWDLVDLSAYKIVGPYLINRSREPLHRLAASHSLWERRIAVLSTFHFIKNNDYSESLEIAGKLLSDPEDLIHKACGWMLREVGKRDMETEESFLRKHYTEMPRTMLRYAIEKFPEARRQAYLKGTVRAG